LIGLCIATGALVAALPVQAFTLAWTHSIEKQRWEEDWTISAEGLRLVEGRIRGFGAGMEAPEGAKLEGGIFRYRPMLAPQATLQLAHSPFAAPYELCLAEGCRSVEQLLPGLPPMATLILSPCKTG
jgi:hypothetical protein